MYTTDRTPLRAQRLPLSQVTTYIAATFFITLNGWCFIRDPAGIAAEPRRRFDDERGHRRVGGPTGARRRSSGRRGKEMRSSGARASETGRRPLLALRTARVLIDDFHRVRHLTLPPPTPRSVCLGVPLATCALPKGVRYLLTYLRPQRPHKRTARSPPARPPGPAPRGTGRDAGRIRSPGPRYSVTRALTAPHLTPALRRAPTPVLSCTRSHFTAAAALTDTRPRCCENLPNTTLSPP